MRKWLVLWALLIGIPITIAWAANTSLSGLSASGAISGTDLVYVVQTPGSGGVKGTAAKIATYINSLFSGDCTATSGGTVTCTKINGNAVPSGVITNQLLVGTGASTFSLKTVPDCADTGGNHINFTQSSNAFSCGTSGGGGGGGQVIHPGYKAGDYYPPFPFTSGTGAAVAANELRCLPYIPPTTSTIDTIAVRTTTLASGGNAQLAIYATSAATKWPTGTPVATTGQFSVDTPTGVKIGSFTSGTGNSGSSYQVVANTFYYICSNSDNATAVYITSTLTNGYVGYLIGSTANNDILASSNGLVLRYTVQTFGTWADLTGVTPVDALATSYAMPAVHITSVP